MFSINAGQQEKFDFQNQLEMIYQHRKIGGSGTYMEVFVRKRNGRSSDPAKNVPRGPSLLPKSLLEV